MARTSVHWFSRPERPNPLEGPLKEPLRERWQRGFLVEYALVGLLVAFTAAHFLFVFIDS